jgi:osmotically-inducible protein OsmY
MSDDRQLQQNVLAELEWEPSVDAAHIGVTANAGVVTLTGHVENFAGKQAAEAAVGRVKGVRAVADDIEVLLPFERKRGDDAIAAAAIERLSWDVSVPRDAVTVRVEAGWVTLTGRVAWYFEKLAAEQDIHRLHGVVGVSNQIVIDGRRAGREVDVIKINDNIMHALKRSWFFDEQTIHVAASDGHVRLTGTARTPHDRQVAAAAAWAGPGVVSVENDITVM